MSHTDEKRLEILADQITAAVVEVASMTQRPIGDVLEVLSLNMPESFREYVPNRFYVPKGSYN